MPTAPTHVPPAAPLMTEPKPRLAQADPDEIFLTPRVVDQRAFDELAGLLRELLTRAGAEGQRLRDSTAGVRELAEKLRHATEQLRAREDRAGKMIAAIDQASAKASVVVKQTIDEAEVRSRLAGALDELIETKRRELSERTAEATAALTGLVQRIAAAKQVAERGLDESEIVRRVNAALDQVVEERVSAVSARLEERAAQVERRVAASLERLDARERELEQRAAELERATAERLQQAEDRVAWIVRHGEQVLSAAKTTSDQLATELETRRDALLAAAASAVEQTREAARIVELELPRIEARVTASETQAARVRERMSRELVETAARLEALAEAHTQLRAEAGHTAELCRQTEAFRAGIADSLTKDWPALQALAEQHDHLVAAIRATLSASREAQDAAASRLSPQTPGVDAMIADAKARDDTRDDARAA